MRSQQSAEYKQFRELVRQAREAAGMTQQEVADALGVPRTVYLKMESGDRRIDFIETLWLAKILRKRLSYFVPPQW